MKLPGKSTRAGFTLAEIAVTIVIVGIGLVMILQTLNLAKFTAAHTANLKLARELALLTLGQIESGLYREEELDGLIGDYGSEGRENFTYEIVVGDGQLPDTEQDPNDPEARFDRFQWDRDQAADRRRESGDDDEDEDEIEEPYERVKIRVTYPKFREFNNQLVLERWIPWDQVYGEDEDEDELEPNAADAPEEENP